MQESLALTSSFPKELSITGHLKMTRREALKMTGRLFTLRMDVNLIGGILDTPELFWSEASLYPLYEAIREYLEIGPRVQVLNDRLAVVGDLVCPPYRPGSRTDYQGGDHARIPRRTSCSSIDLDRYLAYCRCLSC
jgi:hypothetical protein